MSITAWVRKYRIFLIVIGALLIAHHLFYFGIAFDLSDPIGHDWLGLLMIGAGVVS